MTKKILSLSSILLIATLSSSCTLYRITSEEVTTAYHPSKENSEEVVYLEKVDKPHEIVGYVTVNAERRQRINEVITKMKREAAILGGDAITDIRSDSTGTWKRLPVQDLIGNAYVRANFTAAVAVFQ